MKNHIPFGLLALASAGQPTSETKAETKTETTRAPKTGNNPRAHWRKPRVSSKASHHYPRFAKRAKRRAQRAK